MSEAKKVPPLRFKGFDGVWEKKRLGDIGSPYNGLSGKCKSDFGHGNGRYVTYLNVFDNPVAHPDECDKIEVDKSQNEVCNGDVFFTTSSETPEEVGMTSVWDGDGCNTYLNSFCFGYRPRVKIETDFWAYMLRADSFRERIVILAQGISRYNISKRKVMELSVFLPGETEQRKLGELCRSLEVLIASRETALEKLKVLKKAMLEKMFPRANAKVPEVRFKGFEGEWGKKRLEKIAVFNPCCSLPDDFEYVDLESVIGTEMLSHRTEYRDTAPSRAQRLARVGDLFYQTVRPYQKNNYLFELDTLRPYVFSTGYAQLRPRCDGYFLMSAMQTDDFLEIVLQNCTGTSFPAISDTNLSLLSIYLPSLPEQRKIGAYFRSLDALILARRDEIAKLKDLKKALLDRMFV